VMVSATAESRIRFVAGRGEILNAFWRLRTSDSFMAIERIMDPAFIV